MAKKKLKCDKCGKEVDSYSYGDYCSTCADEVWDSGFQSTSEHAYEIGWNDEIKNLKGDWTSKLEKAAHTIWRDYDPVKWKCSKCKKVRLSKKEAGTLTWGEIKAKLKKCSCGVTGHLKPDAPDKWFH